MNIEFKCPQCGQTVSAEESARGQVAECPYCEKGIVVPRNAISVSSPTSLQSPSEKSVSRRSPKLGIRPSATRPSAMIPPRLKLEDDLGNPPPVPPNHNPTSAIDSPKRRNVLAKDTISPIKRNQQTNIKCPNCGTEYEINTGMYGRKAACEICGGSFVIRSPRLCNTTTRSRQDWAARFFALTGRARRREYWLTNLVIVGGGVLLAALFLMMELVLIIDSGNDLESVADSVGFFIGGGVTIILANIGIVPVSVRRLHDRNMSGWWYLLLWGLNLIPVIGFFSGITAFVIMGCLDGTPGENDYGPNPKS